MSADISGSTFSDRLADAFYPLYRRLFGVDSDFAKSVDDSLDAALIDDNVEMHLSKAIAYGAITGGTLWALGMVLGYVLFGLGIIDLGTLIGFQASPQVIDIINMLKIPAFVLFTGLFLGGFGLAVTFGVMAYYPRYIASERKRNMNKLLPDSISFMYALAVGGLNQLEIIRAIAAAEDTYGEVSREFQTVLLETEYFDTDYRTALQKKATQTPSDEFSQFLMDMLAIVNTGGDIERFLEQQKEKHLRLAKQREEQTLETLELFGEMYMTLSLFPLLLIIILVAMSLLGDSQMTLMYGVVYGLLPLIGVAFLVLVSTVKSDEIGEGTLTLNGEVPTERTTNPLVDEGLVDQYDNETNVFDRIRTGEDTYNTTTILQKPHIFFRDNPLYILALTAPMSLVVLAMAIVSPSVPTTFDGIRQAPVWPTFVYLYLPLYINFVPLAIFREWNHRYRYGILTDFSETLRKLSSANDTGETLFDSLETVADSSRGRLAKEFRIMYEKVQYGTNINRALLEFNNKFRIPRLARSIKLISKAQEASNQITEVLTTAAQASENQDDIDRERKSQARMQVVIIMMTFCTLLFVMAILKVEFLETMADLVDASSGDGSSGSSAGGGAGAGGAVGGSGQSFGASIDVPLLSMLFFHAVTLQAVLSGIISGYMRDASILSGVKYSVVLMSLALAVWVAIG